MKLIAGALALLASAVSAQTPGALVVTAVAPGSPAESAGLRAGDRLLRWEQGDSGGPLGSPFELTELEAERGPRDPLRLLGERGGEPLSAALFPDAWGIETRPELGPEALALFEAARSERAAGAIGAERERLRELAARSGGAATWAWLEVARAEQRRGRSDPLIAAVQAGLQAARTEGPAGADVQLRAFLGRALHQMGRFDAAASALGEALASRRERDPDGLATAALAAPLGQVAYDRGRDLEDALAELRAARGLQERLAPRSLAMVRTLNALGPLLASAPEAGELFAEALSLCEELAPGSALMATSLERLASATRDPPRRLELLNRALAIRERIDPEGLEIVTGLRDLAVLLQRGGEVRAAAEHLQRALDIQERSAPDTRAHATLLNYRANFSRDLGDLAQAEVSYRRSIAIMERVQPDSVWLAISLLNLGELLRQRLELDAAERSLRRALAIVEEEQPDGRVAGYIHVTFGAALRQLGDADGAETHLRRALEVFRRADPSHHVTAYAYTELGALLVERDRLEDAGALYRQALEMTSERLPGSFELGDMHDAIGGLELRRGDLDSAERHHRAALELRRQLAPASLSEAQSHHALGRLARRRGRDREALGHFERAVEALEAQGRRLGGGNETAARFRAHYRGYYQALEELLLELGRDQEAFAVLERSRARALLALLSTRDLAFTRDVPEELENERRAADADHDRVLSELGRAGAAPSAGELRRSLVEARRRQDDVRARIRSASPRLAAVRDPEPLDLAGVRRELDPGTLLLCFSVGPESSRVYSVGPGPSAFAVRELGVGEPALRESVERLRALIDQRRGALRGPLDEQSRALTELLLGPFAEPLGEAERVLIVPDGPLHLLPFAALNDPRRPGRGRHLIEALPLHVVSAVTLYARLRGPRRAGRDAVEVVGFGDPVYPARGGDRPASSPTRAALVEALRFEPLPRTREELEALEALAPQRARLFLGADATEERARELDESARVVHFACHGFLDESFPLESGLALSIREDPEPGAQNGLLQAWEVFEAVRLDAELVTLSACQTALGKEVAGEGMLGLTWAFQYAGARSVLASLWEVSDASTAELMRHFYRYLRAGESKAAALRRAQLELLRHPARSAPYFWAAFQLTGDWR